MGLAGRPERAGRTAGVTYFHAGWNCDAPGTVSTVPDDTLAPLLRAWPMFRSRRQPAQAHKIINIFYNQKVKNYSRATASSIALSGHTSFP